MGTISLTTTRTGNTIKIQSGASDAASCVVTCNPTAESELAQSSKRSLRK